VPVAPPFKPGEEVRVTDGALRDQVGWFQRVADRERVVILLSMLGRQLPFTVPLGAVRAAS
jgi:transcription antitermination factor NusG